MNNIIMNLLKDHKPCNDNHQIDRWIIAWKGKGAWGQYKQCLREMDSRVRNIRNNITLRDTLQINVDELEYEIKQNCDSHTKTTVTPLEIRRKKIKLREETDNLINMTTGINEQLRELRPFAAHAINLRKKFPDKLTDEIRENLDLDEYIHSIKAEVASYRIAQPNSLELNIVRQIGTLPQKEKEKLYEELNDFEGLLSLYSNDFKVAISPNELKLAMSDSELLKMTTEAAKKLTFIGESDQ